MTTLSTNSPAAWQVDTDDVPIHPLLRNRYSPRTFDPRPIPEPIIASLIEAARWAPSARNLQPWRFVLAPVTNPARHASMLAALKEGNQVWAQHAPLLIGVLAARLDDRGQPNRTAHYDTGLAVANLTVQAQSHALYIRQMGGIYPERLHATFDIPLTYDVMVVLAVGYRGDAALLPPALREREAAARQRLPLEQLVWGQ